MTTSGPMAGLRERQLPGASVKGAPASRAATPEAHPDHLGAQQPPALSLLRLSLRRGSLANLFISNAAKINNISLACLPQV